MTQLSASRPNRERLRLSALFALLLALQSAIATDGQPILDLGIVGWIDYQRRSLLSEVKEVTIESGKISPTETVVSIYEAVMFHNVDDESHRLVFMPDVGNKMEQAYTSGIIRPDERWGAEFHGFGQFPYRCTMHPEERGEISVIL
jgi:plastocyanin